MENIGNAAMKKEILLLVIASAVSIVVGVASSYVTTYTRLAVLETTTGIHAEKIENQKIEMKDNVALSAIERGKIQEDQRRAADNASIERDKIIAMLKETQKIVQGMDRNLARIEAKLEK